MALTNTSIIPDNSSTSQNFLKSLLGTGNTLIIIIFGDDGTTQNAVQKADYRAGFPIAGIPRRVIWMRDTSMLGFLETLIADGPSYKVTNVDLSKQIGISISMSTLLAYTIPNSPAPDFLTMETAFVAAGSI